MEKRQPFTALPVSSTVKSTRCEFDKLGEFTIFFIAHEDGVPDGYAESNRTKQVIRWKAMGQHLSPEAKSEPLQ